MSRIRLVPCLALLALMPPSGLAAQERASDTLLTVGHFLDMEQVAAPRLSPDGSQIIYTRRWVNRQEDKWESDLWIMGADGARNRFLVKGSGAVWSPDGQRIAYLAEGTPKGSQVFVRYVNADGPATQITRVDEAPGDIRWSPDGSMIGFTQFVTRTDDWKIDLPAAPTGSSWTKAPKYIERLHYRADRQGFLRSGYVHLFVVPADGGTAREVTPGDWNVGARFDGLPGSVGWSWMPDSKALVVEGLQGSDTDTRYRDSDLFLIEVATGSSRKLTPEPGNWNSPVVSPDGRWIAYTGFPTTTKSYLAEDIYLMHTDGSGIRVLSAGFDRDPQDLQWAPDNSGLYFNVGDAGTVNLAFAPLNGPVRRVTSGPQILAVTSISKTGVATGIRSSFQQPADVIRLNLRKPGELTQLTRVNDDVLGNIRLGAVEEIWYRSTGGTRVQGWLVKPPGFDPSRQYPLILEIHGGPHGMYNVGFNYMFQNFAANGYLVLYTNPRGSTGYGTAFGNAIEKAYPSVDYDDLMAGVDTVIGRGYVDTRRMFVSGCSGGGVLSSWVIGHTTRFTAAAVRCPVTNWLSMAGETDVPLFTYQWFAEPFWKNPAPWLERSPLMYVGNVKTPTLVMTGELDMRTPMPQSEEYYAALKMAGVPAALLRFEGEYHGTGSKPSNFMRTQLYMMSWYQRWADSSTTKGQASR